MYNILYASDIYGASGMRRQVGFIPTSYLHNNFNTEMQVISLNILSSFLWRSYTFDHHVIVWQNVPFAQT